MVPRNCVVNIAPRFRSPFWCAMRAASCRSSAANIFCVSAWLRILDVVAVAVRNGVDPGSCLTGRTLNRVRRLQFQIGRAIRLL